MKSILLLALILFLFLIPPSVQAITIQQGVSFNTTGTNTTYIAGANFTVDKITMASTFLNITNSSTGDFIISATPSSGSLNITILGFNTSYKKFNISSNTSGITANFIIGNITPMSALMVFKKNGAYWNTFTSNASGYINFTYNEGYSNIQFEALQDTTLPSVSLTLSSNSIYEGQSVIITCSASDNYQVSSTSLTITKPSGSTTATCNQPFAGTSTAGVYTVTYSATDTSGNSASASQSFSVNQLGGSSSKSSAASEESKVQAITTISSDAMEKIIVNLNAQISGASMTIAKMESAPADISAPVASATETAYQYLNITKNNFNNSQIKNATIEFKVSKSWILANNITNIYLARYENGWKELKTELINQTASQNTYRTYTDGFSYFAIVAEKAKIAQTNDSINDKQLYIQAPIQNETAFESKDYFLPIQAGVAAVLFLALLTLLNKKHVKRNKKEEQRKSRIA